MSQLQHRLESLRADLQSAVRVSHRSIAVLPFSDMSEARDQGYLCEGIAEEILFALSRVKGLRVASRASAFRYRAAGADPAEIGTALQVTTLLDGTVRRAGDRIRITVTLVAVDDGFCLWSERYDRDVRDIFALQDEIARAVVNALEITLSSAEREAVHRLSTRNLDAYDCYLRGRSYFFRFDKRSVGYARDLFEQAIAIDPSYGRACAGISDCSAYLYQNVGRNPADLERAMQAAEAALKLTPDMAEAHSSLGTALSMLGRHDEAEAAFQQAIALNPNLFEAHYFYARDAFTQGRLDLAIREYEEASRVRPEDYQSPLLVAQSYEDLGHADLAKDLAAAGRRHRRGASQDDARRCAGAVHGGERPRRAGRGGEGPRVGDTVRRDGSRRSDAALQRGVHLQPRQPGRRGARLHRGGRRRRHAPARLARARQQPRQHPQHAALPGRDGEALDVR